MVKWVLPLLVFIFCFSTAEAAGGGGGNSIYMPLGSPLVVNVRDGDRSRFLQITSEVRLTAPELGDVVKHHMAMIRHVLIMIFSEQSPAELNSLEGKEELRAQTLEALQMALNEETGEDLIENIYFTGFVIQ